MKWLDIVCLESEDGNPFERDNDHGTQAFDVFVPKGESGEVRLLHNGEWYTVENIAMMVKAAPNRGSNHTLMVQSGTIQVTIRDPQDGWRQVRVQFDHDDNIPLARFEREWKFKEHL